MNLKALIDYGTKKLNHLDNPRLEAEVLMATVLKVDRIFLKVNDSQTVSTANKRLYLDFIDQRSRHKPLAYITGHKDWGNMALTVNESVLIPRDETEQLCQLILAEKYPKKTIKILDIGTGSACIPIFLAKNIQAPQMDITAVDISPNALLLAKENLKKTNTEKLITLIESDLLNNIPTNRSFDIITANLPYLPQKMDLAKDLSYEPQVALFSGVDGLDLIRKLANQLATKHITFSSLWLEFLPQQETSIYEIFKNYTVTFFPDISGATFFTKIERSNSHDADILPQKSK